jgi:hypothetical protein
MEKKIDMKRWNEQEDDTENINDDIVYLGSYRGSIEYFPVHSKEANTLNNQIKIRDKNRMKNAHILACQSPLPVASMFPAGLRSIEMTKESVRTRSMNTKRKYAPEFLCPCSIQCAMAVCESQNCTPRSLEPETTHLPSCETATERT